MNRKSCVLILGIITLGLFSLPSSAEETNAALAKQAAPSAPVVGGGPHANLFPEETLRLGNVDYVRGVEQAGERGRSEEELYALIDDDFVVGFRLQSMVDSGVATKEGDVYRLTSSGRAWAHFFRAARWVYRLRLGG